MKNLTILFLVFAPVFVTVLSTPLSSIAARSDTNLIPLGPGISRASHISQTFSLENPAIQGSQNGFGVHLSGRTSQSDADPLNPFFGTIWGNGDFGLSLGISNEAGSGYVDEELDYFWGFGAVVSSLNMAFGISGATFNTDDGGSSRTENAGLLFNPFDALTIGITAYDVFGDLDVYGWGFNIAFNDTWSISIDGTINKETDLENYWAGFLYSGSDGGLELSLGANYSRDSLDNTDTDAFAALALRPNEFFSFVFQYQLIQKYFVGLSFWF